MPKYIDADALLREAKRLSGPQTGDGWDNWGVYALIERQPAADVIPVVRCKDCRYTKTDGIDAIYCQKWDRWEMPPNAYCYLGEKRKAKPLKEKDDGTV